MTPDMPPQEELSLPLRTPRLILRDFRDEDFDAIHAYGSDPEVCRYMPWGPNTLEDTAQALARMQAQARTWPRMELGLGIELAGEGRLIGSIALHLRDATHRTVEMGYCLHRDYWGRGIMSEAARGLADAGFRRFGLHRIYATCDVRNTGSWRVMETLGMRREGLLRQDRVVKGAWRDTYLYAVLAEEWAASAASAPG